MRDYGTGVWDGGDPDCDHLVRNDPKVELSTLGGGKATTGHQRVGWKDSCPRCGATRVDQQIGLEATPDLFVASMVEVFREVRRVLRRDGTCWVNLGDSYVSTAPGTADKPQRMNGMADDHRGSQRTRPRVDTLKPKDLVGMPWRVAFALQADGWYLRSDIVWSKPNPMPESVTDRPTKAHEYVFLLTRSPRYYYDADAIREPRIMDGAWDADAQSRQDWSHRKEADQTGHSRNGMARRPDMFHSAGRNVRSVWEIATQPYPDAHFATFPEELPRRCILAGTSERGCCPVCGAPWEREAIVSYEKDGSCTTGKTRDLKEPDGRTNGTGFTGKPKMRKTTETLGWRPSCTHDQHPVPCTVLDPFMGSGTTALVARKLGRRSIGIELNESYAALCARRLQQLSLFAGEPT